MDRKNIDKAQAFKNEVYEELVSNILHFWEIKMSDTRGGFYGRIDGKNVLDPEAPKGAILNARILYSFARMLEHSDKASWLASAKRAKDYIERFFIDSEYGGVYWSLNPNGSPLDNKKQFYAIGFTIYGLSEYARTTGDKDAKKLALELFETIEKYSRDPESGGYFEAATRDWKPIDDMRLSDKDDNACKTMNTHLHILEPYTNLLRIDPENKKLREAIKDLINIFLDKIEDPKTHHLRLFFDKDWKRRDKEISYGHDIEASWLLLEAAQVLGDDELLKKTMTHTRNIALAALEGRCADGSMVYERHGNGHYDNDKHWWVQAETVIGQLYLWKYHGMEDMLDKAILTWNYIKDNLIDKKNGEWFWSRRGKEINREDDKAGFWKCPYHNSRMCYEVMNLIDSTY